MLQPAHGHGVGIPHQHPTSKDCPRCPAGKDVATTKRRKSYRVPFVEDRRYVERVLRWYIIARESVKPCHQQFNGFHLVASPVGNGHGDSCCHAVSLLSSLIFVELLRKRRYILNISNIRPCLSSTNPHPGNVAVEIRQGQFFFSLSQPPHQHSQKAEQHPASGICSAFFCHVATRHVRAVAGR